MELIPYRGSGFASRTGRLTTAAGGRGDGVDFLVAYGSTLNVEILSQALFSETSFVGNICGNDNELVESVALAARGAVTLATTTFPLESINEALHALDEGRMIGRGPLVPNEK